MQRNYLRGLLICLIPCLVAGYFTIWAYVKERFKLGIDLAGGTILVYEINLERTRQLTEARRGQADQPPQEAGAGLSNDDMLKLATQIKRRIDPADLKNVTVRPLGNTRVEIILPTGGAGTGGRSNLSVEEIEEVKRLVSQMGVLEFRILANQTDDETGIRVARDMIRDASPDDIASWASRGVPPPPPDGEYDVKAESDKPSKVRYAWVELGPEERETLGLQNAMEGAGGGLWGQLAAARAAPAGQERTVLHSYSNEGKTASMVFYSREVKNQNWLDKEARDRERLEKEGKLDEFNPKKYEYFVLTRVSPVDNVKVEGDISLTATSDIDPKSFNPCVSFTFNSAGAKAFGAMTERNKPSQNAIRTLAILLDERVVSAPTLNAVITSRGQITGRFDKKSVDRLVNFLRNGALNAQLREKPVSENTIGPTLGADTIRKGTMAVGLAFAVVLVFMVIYYRFAGFVACVALLANLLLTVGFMVAVNAAFTLPGLAGIVLMLGMAVDANVLIYERLREERNKGANLATAIRNGYDRAFFTIIDTHLTSIFTAIVLYTFGNDQLKGFAISLTVGLVISLFTSLYMTRLMFDYWLHRHWLTELKMMRLFERPNFNPMKYRFYFFSITGVLTVLGLALFLYRGDSGLNVDFRGGTVYGGKLKEGEERALTTVTVNGREYTGLRELLSEQAQNERLKVDSVRLLNRPASGDLAALGTYDFEITYADKATTTVSLTQKPAGNTVEEVENSVKEMAQHLPDVSVEQLFVGDKRYDGGRSEYFTIRTTERQPELVRATLDRLLRDDQGTPLVASTDVTAKSVTGPVVELTFDRTTSPSRIRDLLDREFRKENAVDPTGATFELKTPAAELGENGRFTTMWVDVSKNASFAALRKHALAEEVGGPAGAAVVGWPAAVRTAAALADPEYDAQVKGLQSILAKTEQAVETRPEPLRLEVFDSQLASETRSSAFRAILLSWLAILLYLWFRFHNWTFGLAAVICLVHDLCFTLGAIAACHYLHLIPGLNFLGIEDFKIDLPAVAALLTLVGYSVNEIIVNFARIREVRGKNPMLTPQMINDSVNQTLSRTILTSMTVLLVSLVLYIFGGEGVHLFAFVMVMGVMVSTYSSIFVASPLLLFLGEGSHAEPAEAPKPEAEEPAAALEG
jgi:SecD/SecF fusion protein